MSSDVHDRVLQHLAGTGFDPEVKDLGDFELKGLVDSTHIYQILPSSLKSRVFSKETSLADEKKKLEEQLREMQERNSILALQLTEMDSNVKDQVQQANALLSEVQDANFSSMDPVQMLGTLRGQLLALVKGQSATAEELEKAKSVNEELFRMANESAERREKIAQQTFDLKRQDLEEQISLAQQEIDERSEAERVLKARVQDLEAQLNDTNEQAKNHLDESKSELVSQEKEKGVC